MSQEFSLSPEEALPMSQEFLFPTEQVPYPWDEMLVFLNESKIRLSKVPTSLELFLIAPQVGLWNSALHWVYRKTWNSRHKVPGGRKVAQLSEPLGDLFIAIKELCKECHFLLGEEATGYPCAAKWFGHIAYEYRYWKVVKALARSKKSGRTAETKPQMIEEVRQIIIAPLKDAEPCNPFDPVEKHLYCLINHAIEFSNTSDQFRRKYWQPFIRAWQKWIKHVETHPEFSKHWVEDGKIFIQNGRGRSKLKFQPNNETLKFLQEAGFTT